MVTCVACDAQKMAQLAARTPLFGSLLVFDPETQNAQKFLISNHRNSQQSSAAVPIYLPPKEKAFVNAMSKLYLKIGNKKTLEVIVKLADIDELRHFSAGNLYTDNRAKQQLIQDISQNFSLLAQNNKLALLMMDTMKLATDAMLRVDLSIILIVECSDSSQLVYKIGVKNALIAEHLANDSRNFNSKQQIFANN